MYHRIAPETPEAGAQWATTPWAFEEQLAWLRDQRYESVSIDEWAVSVANDAALPGRRVLITFDDGLQDFADHALPLLIAYGFRADMHIVTGHVGGTNAWEKPGFPSYRLMDWQTILDLPRDTVTIGSHTVNHARFAGLDPATVMDEMLRSRLELEERLGRQVTRIAYPWGLTDESTPSLAVAAGYDVCLHHRRAVCRPGMQSAGHPPPRDPRRAQHRAVRETGEQCLSSRTHRALY